MQGSLRWRMVRALPGVCYARLMSPMDRPLRIVPRVSRTALVACALTHVSAVGAVLIAWPWSLLSGGAALLIVASGVTSLVQLTQVPRQFAAVLLTGDQHWVLTDAAGNRTPATLRGSPIIASSFVVVPLRTGAARYTWLVTRGTTPADSLRRLRVRLSYESATSATASAAE